MLSNLIRNKIIILNGCPSTGKDTLTSYIFDNTSCEWESFKTPLFEIASAVSGINLNYLYALYELPGWKETEQDFFGGLSCRQFFIKISEEWVKPIFGKSYFGDKMVERLDNNIQNGVVVSDGGFSEELAPLIKAFGKNNVIVVRIYRNGYTFEGDSRTYLHSAMFEAGKEPIFLDVHNKADNAENFCKEAVEQIEDFLKTISYDTH